MDRPLAELEAIVRKRICSVCTERTAAGMCGLDEPSRCALFHLFPRVAQSIQSVNSIEIQPYIDAIRRDVCTVCEECEAAGGCESRRQARCALDAYLPLVVEAIEEATGRVFDKTSLAGA